MKLNYYIIASLTDLTWDGDMKGTLNEFLDAYDLFFEPYRPVISAFLLYNEIRNVELLLRSRLNKDHYYGDPFSPALLAPEELKQYLDMPLPNHPEEFPDYFTDFLVSYHDDSQRLEKIEELYHNYYDDLKTSSDPFLAFFANTLHSIRTVLSALRLKNADLPIEEHLKGDDEIVSLIMANRNSADLGLKKLFPEIDRLQSLLEKPELDRERELDRFIIHRLSGYREDDPFGDHVIFLYILSLFFRDRWVLLDEKRGKRVIEEILEA